VRPEIGLITLLESLPRSPPMTARQRQTTTAGDSQRPMTSGLGYLDNSDNHHQRPRSCSPSPLGPNLDQTELGRKARRTLVSNSARQRKPRTPHHAAQRARTVEAHGAHQAPRARTQATRHEASTGTPPVTTKAAGPRLNSIRSSSQAATKQQPSSNQQQPPQRPSRAD
jgi:hypothetical protein